VQCLTQEAKASLPAEIPLLLYCLLYAQHQLKSTWVTDGIHLVSLGIIIAVLRQVTVVLQCLRSSTVGLLM